MTPKNPNNHWIMLIISIVLAFLVSAGTVCLIQMPILSKLDNRLYTIETELEDIAHTPGSPNIDCSNSQIDSDQSNGEEPAKAVDEDATTDTMLSWTTYALLEKARYTDGVTYATLDYIQVFTGNAAIEAAAAHGEKPTSDGYYIVNACPALHEYPIDDAITISVVYNEVTGWDPDAPVFLSLEEWRRRAILSMETMYGIHYYSMYNIVTVTNGTITAMDQQYLP